ncbi:MAG: class I SAM-dependent methyltransferase [Candidatus Thorarchaeota archaeon]|jgi:putative AdoMet-dependent methyltransferase
MTPERNPEFFDRWAAEYDWFVGGWANSFPFEGYDSLLNRIVELADPQPGMKILDMGIGTGNLAERFINKECEIWGIDFSEKMLEVAKKKIPSAHLMQVDILSDWPSELEGGFDRIVSAYVFHHFNLETKLKVIDRVLNELLRDNGFIIIGDTSYPSFAARASARKELIDVWDDSEFYWAADEVKLMSWGQGAHIVYEQVSSCGGVYLIVPT